MRQGGFSLVHGLPIQNACFIGFVMREMWNAFAQTWIVSTLSNFYAALPGFALVGGI